MLDNKEGGAWVEASVGKGGFRADVIARHHRLTVDEPEAVGGTDAGPTPYEYILTALASCTAMTMHVYAKRKQWPLETATVSVRQGRSHERDCEDCDTQAVGIGKVERRIEMTGDLTDEQRRRIIEIADRCPIKQTLGRGIVIEDSAS